jgi:alpha-beta hydrolase superfamily lysophospholipase
MEEQTFTDGHGVQVFTRWWPIDSPAGVVLVVHGASEHSARYDRFAQALNASGFAVAALDTRGHGHSEPAGNTAIVGAGGGQALVDDIHELRAQVSERFAADVPVTIFGHSLGSLMTLAYLTQHADGLRSAVLSGFPADVNGVEALGELLTAVAEATGRDEPVGDLTGASSAEGVRTRYDWLSRDEAEVDAYVADPLCGDEHPLTNGYLIDLFDVVAPAAGALDAIGGLPLLNIAGSEDPAAGMGAYPKALTAALQAAGQQVDETIYEGARHELLNETNRDAVTADVIAWLQAH